VNDATNKTRSSACGWLLLSVAGCCCLLLPVVALLFTLGGMPVSGSTARPRIAQPTENLTATANQDTLLASADATDGKQLFNTFQPAAGIACATCHHVDSEERLVGPGLLNVAKRAQSRVQGLSAVEYLRQSIVRPSAYVVAGYADLMPKNWGHVFSSKQIDDLIAYLLTLKGG
jgi:mono/diheme cytochrome c family protein